MNTERIALVAIIAVVLVAGLCAAIFLFGSPGPEPRPAAAGQAASQGAPLPADLAGKANGAGTIPGAGADEEAEPTRVAVPVRPGGSGDSGADGEKGNGVITGRILDEGGAPLAGAVIRPAMTPRLILSGASGKDAGKPRPAGESPCLSGADGVFRLEGIKGKGDLGLRVTHAGHVPSTFEVSAFAGGVRDVGDVFLEVGGAVAGLVTDKNGAPIEGAEVSGTPEDREGGSGYLLLSSILTLDPPWKAVTGPRGTFRIEGLPAGKVRLTACHPKHPAASASGITVVKGRATEGVVLVLPPGFPIAGRVVTAKGRPVPNALVVRKPRLEIDFSDLENMSFNNISRLASDKTDAEGRFLLEGLPEGLCGLKVSASGYPDLEREGIKAGATNLVLVLKAGARLAGRVVDGRTGEGIEEFSLEAVQEGTDQRSIRVAKGAEALSASPEGREGKGADPRGAFLVEGLSAGTVRLRAAAGGYGDEEVDARAVATGGGSGGGVTVRLWKEAVVTGRLLDFTGEPVEEGEVRLAAPKESLPGTPAAGSGDGKAGPWSCWKKVKSGPGGAFRLEGVREGAYRLEASHPMHTDAEPVPIVIRRGGEAAGLEIRLGPAGSIAGTVFGAGGEPLPGARISAARGGGIMGMLAAGVEGTGVDLDMRDTAADSEGNYRIDGLKPGRYRVRLLGKEVDESLGAALDAGLSAALGGGGPQVVSVTVRAGEVTKLDLHEIRKGAVRGTVLAGGRPAAGMRVALFRSGLLALFPLKTTTTDPDGGYRFTAVEAGGYDVSLGLPGHAEALKESVSVGEGEEAVLDFDLPVGDVTGRVVDAETGEPVSGILVTLKPRGGSQKKKGLLDLLFSGGSMETGKVDSGSWEAADIGEADSGSAATDGIPFGIGGRPKPVRTGADGRFAVSYVAEGEYSLEARGGGCGYATGELARVRVAPGGITAAGDLPIPRGFRIAGIVVGGNGKPAAGARVSCFSIDKPGGKEGPRAGSCSAGKDGRFDFAGLKPGYYRLKAEAAPAAGRGPGFGRGPRRGEMEIELGKSDVKDVTIRFR